MREKPLISNVGISTCLPKWQDFWNGAVFVPYWEGEGGFTHMFGEGVQSRGGERDKGVLIGDVSWECGPCGQVLRFPGNGNDYVRYDDALLPLTTPTFTAALYISSKPSAAKPDNACLVMGEASGFLMHVFYYNSDGNVRWWASNAERCEANNVVTDDSYNLIVFRQESAASRSLFVNGFLADTDTADLSNIASNDRVEVGGTTRWGQWYNGDICFFVLWQDRALDSGIISEWAADPFGPLEIQEPVPQVFGDVPPGPAISNYYSGGSIAAQRLTRGIGWVQ